MQLSTGLDRAGATLSIICAIHCLATPLILISLPAAAKHSEAAEAWIVGASLLIGLSAIRASRRRSGALPPRIGIALGLAAIVGSRLLSHGLAETVLVFSGAATLVTAHLFNCRECRHGCGQPVHEARSGAGPFLLLTLLAAVSAASPASAGSLEPATLPSTVVAAAGTYVGLPYRLGGTSARGLDCSALVQNIFRAAGLELPRTAREQFLRGYAVVRQELLAGDLVFFRGARSLSQIMHVGIYIGGGRFIHAGRHGVVVASLSAAHWVRRFAGARRMIGVAQAVVFESELCVDGGKRP